MKIILYILLLLINLLCHSSTHGIVVQKGSSKSIPELTENMIDANDMADYIDSLYYNLNRLATGDYNTVKDKCIKERNRLCNVYTNTFDDSVRQVVLNEGGILIENILVNEIIPFWYGTPWDFNGYTNTPGKGETRPSRIRKPGPCWTNTWKLKERTSG